MKWLFVILCIATITEITSYIEDHVKEYFNSEIAKRSTELWQKQMIAYQNTLSIALQENYGFKSLNVYIKRNSNPLLVSSGYYHSDNHVHILFQNMILEEFPHLSDIDVSFPLTSNVIQLNAAVSRMIIHSKYTQFRNISNIIYDLRHQNSYVTSPFLFEQAQKIGQIAITVEGCRLSGVGIATLSGRTVSLGNTMFRLRNCQYNFEIFTPGVPSPPVVANYLPYSKEGLTLEHLIMRPLEAELSPTLQAILHSYINTSNIFLESLPEVRFEQEKILELTTIYVDNVVRNLNMLTINKMGSIKIDDFKIYWNDSFEEEPVDCVTTLNNMFLTGLETVYSSHTGGPFELTTIKISEELRYSALQVRGSIAFQVGDQTKGMYDFAVEINDVAVDVSANLIGEAGADTRSRYFNFIEVIGWRTFEFSSPGMADVAGEALVTGYLLTKLPVYLAKHMNTLLPEAVRLVDNDGEEKAVLHGDGGPEGFEGSENNGQEVISPEGGLDDGQEITNPEGSFDEGEGVNNPDGSFDDGQGVINPEGNFDDGQGIINPKGSFDDEQGIISPEGHFDEGKEMINSEGNFDEGQEMINPKGSFDDGHEMVNPESSFDDGHKMIKPEDSFYYEQGMNNPEGNFDDGQGIMNPESSFDDEQGMNNPEGNFDDGQGIMNPEGSFDDGQVNNENADLDYEPITKDPGEPLSPQDHFDENVFESVQNQNQQNLVGKLLRQKRRNLRKNVVRKPTRTTKTLRNRNLTENEVR